MEKIDLKKKFKELYNPSEKKVAVVEVPCMNFLMIDGIGDPKAQEFQRAAEALYSVSYTLKFMEKKRDGGVDYTVHLTSLVIHMVVSALRQKGPETDATLDTVKNSIFAPSPAFSL